MALPPWDVRNISFVKSCAQRGQYPAPGISQVAFAGRSNVGKSSFLNLLARQKNLAKTSRTPGRTQLINFFLVNERVYYVDLPGYGFAQAPLAEMEKWRRMIDSFMKDNQDLRLVIVLLDARRFPPSPLDDQLIDFLADTDVYVQVVLTKCDKLKSQSLQQARRAIAEHYGFDDDNLPIATSATTGAGRDEVLRMIHEYVEEE
jgi:GTP-binding protein